MLINSNDLNYLNAIQAKIKKGEPIKRKISDALGSKIDPRMMFCTECDTDLDDWWEGHLIMTDANGDRFIAIACEGFYPIDINW